MAQQVYVFKVALSGQTSVWRRIAVRAKQTLDDLHEAIYRAFDRYDEHLYSFYFPRPGSRGRARLRDAAEYSHPYMTEEPNSITGDSPANAAEMRIETLDLKPRQTFFYLFDFGDEWWHEIAVEQVDSPAEKGRYPRILEKCGNSPPQYPDPEEDQ